MGTGIAAYHAGCLPFYCTVLASKFSNFNLKPIEVALNTIQAWTLWKGAQDSEKFQKAYKAQTYFNIANITVSFWSFGCLVNELGKKDSLFKTWTGLWNSYDFRGIGKAIWTDIHPTWTSDAQARFGLYGYGVLLIGSAAIAIAVSLINKVHAFSQRQLTIEEHGSEDKQKQEMLAKEVKISWDRPLGQKFAQWVYISQLCLNVALAALSSSPIYFAINLVLSGYALYQITDRKWLNVSRTKQWEFSSNNIYITSVTAVYHCFLMAFSPQKDQQTDNCSICCESDPDAYFHGKHLFHEKCLIQLLIEKSSDFANIPSLTRKESRDRNGNHSIDYTVKISNSKLPECPNCREKPFHNELDIIVHEPSSSKSAKIIWGE
jgi:hypothetical protein